MSRLPAALLALAAIAFAVWRLEGATAGLAVTRMDIHGTPVTVFRQAALPGNARTPVVLIAHGFAGSQQLMQPFATTLARNGFVAITFDFPGHGRNAAPMTGGLVDQQESLRTLLAALDKMGAFARQVHGGGGRYAVLGHSMASDIVVRHAQAHPDVVATVAVSLFAPSIEPTTPANSPRNLLVIDGALEPGMMAKEALRVVGQVAGPAAIAGQTYGRFVDGTARRATLSPGVEHIGVLYSGATQAEALAWLHSAYGLPQAPSVFVDARGRWLGLLLLGIVGLAWSLSTALPRCRATAGGMIGPERARWWAWRGYLPLAVLPALVTPLLLWKVPTDFLPILLGDYLVLHFALYGLLTLGLLAWRRQPWPRIADGRLGWWVVGALAVTGYALLVMGLPLDRYVFNMMPEPVRLPIILALAAGTLPYFLADEWLTRDPAAPRAAYLVTKLCFLLSLVVAIALNPMRLFFLAIIVPAILLLFIVYGLFSRWAFRATGLPWAGAAANALAFAGFVAISFPLVS